MLDLIKFATALRVTRAERRVSQRVASAQAGLAFGTLCDLENEKSTAPAFDTIAKLCRWMDRPVEDFLLEEAPEETHEVDAPPKDRHPAHAEAA